MSSNGVDAEGQLVITGLLPAPTLWAVIPPRGVIGGGTRIQVVALFPNNDNSILLSEQESPSNTKCKFGSTVVNVSIFHVSDVSISHLP